MNYFNYKNINLENLRKNFPILNTKISNKYPLIYLDNAATSQKPLEVINAVNNFYTNCNANTNRGPHYLSDLATFEFEAAREKVKKFINAKSNMECIFTKGTTEAINLIANSFGGKFFQEGDEVLLSQMEHHANIVPWQLLKLHKNIKLNIIPMLNSGELDLTQIEKLLTPKTKLVSIIHVSNTLGTINPIKKIIDLAHKHHIPVLIDGAQAINHLPIDVEALDCDFYVFSGHKMFGPTGIGVLYGKKSYLDLMPPYQGGGQMILKVSFKETIFNDLPYKFEAGTQPIASAVGLGAAIDYLNQLNLNDLWQHEKNLLAYAKNKLKKINGIKIIGDPKEQISIISFVMENIHPHDVGTILNNYGIAIRTGHLCTMPIMDFYEISAVNRVSFSFYNTFEEIDQLYLGLLEVKKIFKQK